MALSDILNAKIVELGKIKIGTVGEERSAKGGGKFRLPQKLDHFLITGHSRGANGQLQVDQKLMDDLIGLHGDQDGHLRQLPIALLSNELDDVLQAAWVCYKGKKCYARGDGVTVTWYYDRKTNKELPEPAVYDWEPKYAEVMDGKQRLFKRHVVLNCVISGAQARFGGVYRFRTTSMISGDQLYGSLTQVRALTGGVLFGMPLWLVVRPVVVSPEGTTTTVYVVHAELRGDDLQALQQKALDVARFQRQHRQELGTVRRELKLLMVQPGLEDEAEASDVVEEFHPQTAVVPAVPTSPEDALKANLLGMLNKDIGCKDDMDRDAICTWAMGGPEFIDDVLKDPEAISGVMDRLRRYMADGLPLDNLLEMALEEVGRLAGQEDSEDHDTSDDTEPAGVEAASAE